ncbi:hypothetical protein [Halosimplex pelagicum]|uniref:Uncharacterized protein n=1 Tax=Halosimplex pelagicum TaxID=869886 RepID=A0A7D5T3S5_9EURY|nr:hypothetical protein [Halosimplex pelagicum]QLH80988.1 hypothetical protein HZS54_04760 [Halosimplex pelagicum]
MNETPLSIDRRAFLQSAVAVAGGGLAAGGESEPTESVATIPTTPEEIRAAFDDVPRLDEPAPRQRRLANNYFPEEVVPKSGPVPDPRAGYTEVDVTVPRWVLASVYRDLNDWPETSRGAAVDQLLSVHSIHEHHVLPDGRDAAEVVVEAVEQGEP